MRRRGSRWVYLSRFGPTSNVSVTSAIDRHAKSYVIKVPPDVSRINAELARRIDLSQISIEMLSSVMDVRGSAVYFPLNRIGRRENE